MSRLCASAISDLRTTYVLDGPFEPHFEPTRNLSENAEPNVADCPISCARKPSQARPASACPRATACTHPAPSSRYLTLFGLTPTSASIGSTIDFHPIVNTAIDFPASCFGLLIFDLPGSTKSKTCAGYCSQIETTGTPASIEDVSTPGDG